MQELWTWLLGLGVVGYLALRWYSERTYRENMSEFNNRLLNNQINARDEAIKESIKKQSETLNEYYSKIADYNRKHGTKFPTKPTEGGDAS